jgi:hypothetical protein
MGRGRPSVRNLITSGALVFAALPACRQQKPDPAVQANPAAGTAATPAIVNQAPISDEERQEYAQALVNAVESGDQAGFNALIDWDSIFATATAGLDAPKAQVAAWIRGMKTAMVQNSGYAGALIQNSKSGGRLDYLRTKLSHGQQMIVLRMIGPEGQGVNYIEFAASRGADQKIRATNFYPFIAGEFISDTIHRGMLPLAAAESRTFLDKLLTQEQDYVRDLPKLKPISDAILKGNKQDALRQIKDLRPGTKKEKSVLLIRIQAAQEIDESDYVATLEEYRTLFPNDPSLDLQSIDYYTLKRDFANVLKCIDRLDQSVGGDPYLNCIRASVAIERGDGAEARRLAKLTIDQEPSLQSPYFLLIDVSLKEKKYDETLAGLKQFHGAFGMILEDLPSVPEYAGFVKSPQYQEWLKYVKAQSEQQKATHGQEPKSGQSPVQGPDKQPSRP